MGQNLKSLLFLKGFCPVPRRCHRRAPQISVAPAASASDLGTYAALESLHLRAGRPRARPLGLSNSFSEGLGQVSPYLLTPPPRCGSKEVIYDPSHCLVERQWAGYFFHLSLGAPKRARNASKCLESQGFEAAQGSQELETAPRNPLPPFNVSVAGVLRFQRSSKSREPIASLWLLHTNREPLPMSDVSNS